MLSLLHRLIYREVIGPWLFGVAMFTMVLMAGTYLFRLTDLLVKGIDLWTVLELSLLYLPAIVAKTFPMSVLLGCLLAFARLSNDSEIVAVQASGGSFFNIMWPVALFGFSVSALTFAFGEVVVPPSSLKAVKLQFEISKTLKLATGTSFYQPLYIGGRFRGHIMARTISLSTDTMYDVTGVWFDKDGEFQLMFTAEEMYYAPTEEWRLRNVRIFYDPEAKTSTFFEDAGSPPGTTFDFTPQDVLTSRLKDPDALAMAELGRQIKRLSGDPRGNMARIRDLQVGYWTKVTLPLSAIVFALVGAQAAIRRGRQTVGAGVAVSITVIFIYYLLHNYLTIVAKGGLLHPAVSAFTPVFLGLVAAVVMFWNKNR
ncbi:MAG: LptF/LptG family permease [Armatimonadetes bacterium]|nr:LptF/LptG family permease [Armatimonadota bacterium]